ISVCSESALGEPEESPGRGDPGNRGGAGVPAPGNTGRTEVSAGRSGSSGTGAGRVSVRSESAGRLSGFGSEGVSAPVAARPGSGTDSVGSASAGSGLAMAAGSGSAG